MIAVNAPIVTISLSALAHPIKETIVQLKMRILGCAVLLGATSASPQSVLADECRDRATTRDVVECIRKQTASWDAVVEFAIGKSLSSTKGDASKMLKQAQEHWLRYRNANCEAAGMGEGTIASVNAAECCLRMTKARAAELGGNDEPSQVAQASPDPIMRESEDLNSGSHRDDPPDGADPVPASKIREVYSLLAADKFNKANNPIVNPRLARSFFARPFLDLWAKDQNCWNGAGTEGAAQMWVGGQDYKISDIKVSVPMGTADYQRVLASFKSFEVEQHWSYEFRRVGNVWLVQDVLLEGRSLSKAMTQGCRK
jgi:uncharacterized protein YecT (DUF1311 family)